jgi:GalNAc-alpha-(1->4)-GalNAc-alpha-(1->3)-diNAcBac-PP-undecaprenol alpha-1,4-N-acetyl-D-galactosaminyltransferase
MDSREKTKVCLITSDLGQGGAQRVMSILANGMAARTGLEVHLIVMLAADRFYSLDHRVIVHEPSFDYRLGSRVAALIRTFIFVRSSLKRIQPHAQLVFGGRYNAFVLLASVGLRVRTYLSERSRPGISYGWLLDRLNPWVYRLAAGIIAQTSIAKDHALRTVRGASVSVVGNPVPNLLNPSIRRKQVVLNVGRFIASKQQQVLIKLFVGLNAPGWELWLIGEGPMRAACESQVQSWGATDRVRFYDNESDITRYYQQAAVFAFTSASEGFPNALAEAMSAGCACISYDCVAGPSDLIDHGQTGILVPLNDESAFQRGLTDLLGNESLRTQLGNRAAASMEKFSETAMVESYMSILLQNK